MAIVDLRTDNAGKRLGHQGLRKLIDGDRYPLSPRITVLRDILAKLRPEPERASPPPPPRHYEPQSRGRFSRRR